MGSPISSLWTPGERSSLWSWVGREDIADWHGCRRRSPPRLTRARSVAPHTGWGPRSDRGSSAKVEEVIQKREHVLGPVGGLDGDGGKHPRLPKTLHHPTSVDYLLDARRRPILSGVLDDVASERAFHNPGAGRRPEGASSQGLLSCLSASQNRMLLAISGNPIAPASPSPWFHAGA